MRATLLALLILATAPASALGGGFATVGLSSTPDGTAPGEPWIVDLTILQHGRSETPLNGLRPTLTVRGPGGERRTFAASPAGRPGVYRARVVFRSVGTWRYEVNDDFPGVVHTYPPLAIRGGSARAAPATAAAKPGGGPNVGLALAAAALAGLAAGLAARLARPARGAGRPAEA